MAITAASINALMMDELYRDPESAADAVCAAIDGGAEPEFIHGMFMDCASRGIDVGTAIAKKMQREQKLMDAFRSKKPINSLVTARLGLPTRTVVHRLRWNAPQPIIVTAVDDHPFENDGQCSGICTKCEGIAPEHSSFVDAKGDVVRIAKERQQRT